MTKFVKPLLLLSMLVTAQATFAMPFSRDCVDCPLRVPPAGTAGITTSTISVPETATINDLDVFVSISHTFVGDLRITLSHAGTSVLLFDQHGGSGDDVRRVFFDDEASTPIASGSAPYGPGAFRPEGSLASFDGHNIAGEWTLTIWDRLFFDRGRLHNWRLVADVTDVPETAPTALLGLGLLGLGFTRMRRRKIK